MAGDLPGSDTRRSARERAPACLRRSGRRRSRGRRGSFRALSRAATHRSPGPRRRRGPVDRRRQERDRAVRARTRIHRWRGKKRRSAGCCCTSWSARTSKEAGPAMAVKIGRHRAAVGHGLAASAPNRVRENPAPSGRYRPRSDSKSNSFRSARCDGPTCWIARRIRADRPGDSRSHPASIALMRWRGNPGCL